MPFKSEETKNYRLFFFAESSKENSAKILLERSPQIKIRSNVNATPVKAKYKPFLKTVVLGKNIQKDDTTKNNSDKPKTH